MRPTIDLNADLGEGMPWDAELLELVTSANVSCGAHAGDPSAIEATLVGARRNGVVVGAHPSWPDRAGFGRSERAASTDEVTTLILAQVHWLADLGGLHGIAVRYVKPHGALYNQAMRDGADDLAIANGLVAALTSLELPLMGQPGTAIERLATSILSAYVREGFPDRRYRDDGRLVPRSTPGALVEGVDEVVAQAVRLVEGGTVDSLCLHGDSPGAVARARAIRHALDRRGIAVRSVFAAGTSHE